jgi:hypothetical protein
MLIAPMAQCLAAPDPARAAGGKCVFSNIHAHRRTGCHLVCVVALYDQIEKPATPAKHQFRFLRPRLATLQDLSLVIPQNHWHEYSSPQRIERDVMALKRIGTAVEMDTRSVETQGGNRSICGDTPKRALRAISLTHREDGIAYHLRSEGRFLPEAPITEVMQGDSIPTALILNKRNEPIAGLCISRPQRAQALTLVRRHVESNAHGAQHVLGARNVR